MEMAYVRLAASKYYKALQVTCVHQTFLNLYVEGRGIFWLRANI